jgi:hypothetical protein
LKSGSGDISGSRAISGALAKKYSKICKGLIADKK